MRQEARNYYQDTVSEVRVLLLNTAYMAGRSVATRDNLSTGWSGRGAYYSAYRRAGGRTPTERDYGLRPAVG